MSVINSKIKTDDQPQTCAALRATPARLFWRQKVPKTANLEFECGRARSHCLAGVNPAPVRIGHPPGSESLEVRGLTPNFKRKTASM